MCVGVGGWGFVGGSVFRFWGMSFSRIALRGVTLWGCLVLPSDVFVWGWMWY